MAEFRKRVNEKLIVDVLAEDSNPIFQLSGKSPPGAP
jgi:hypothetical protein